MTCSSLDLVQPFSQSVCLSFVVLNRERKNSGSKRLNHRQTQKAWFCVFALTLLRLTMLRQRVSWSHSREDEMFVPHEHGWCRPFVDQWTKISPTVREVIHYRIFQLFSLARSPFHSQSLFSSLSPAVRLKSSMLYRLIAGKGRERERSRRRRREEGMRSSFHCLFFHLGKSFFSCPVFPRCLSASHPSFTWSKDIACCPLCCQGDTKEYTHISGFPKSKCHPYDVHMTAANISR